MKLLKILLGAALVAGQQQDNEWEQPNGPFGKIYIDPRRVGPDPKFKF